MTQRKKSFTIDGFRRAKPETNDDQDLLLTEIANRLNTGSADIPEMSKVDRIVVVGHAKGTNPKPHAESRQKFVYERFRKILREVFGLSDEKVEPGVPVFEKVPSNSGVTGADRKAVIHIFWTKSKTKLTPGPALSDYLDREPPNEWTNNDWCNLGKINNTTEVWTGFADWWRRDMRNDPFFQTYNKDYAGIVKVIDRQRRPPTSLHSLQPSEFPRVTRRVRLREIEEFLYALYTAGPEFAWGTDNLVGRGRIARIIERHQHLTIERFSQSNGRFKARHLMPIMDDSTAIRKNGAIPQAMVKNAAATAERCLILYERGYEKKLAGDVTRNCGTIISYAIKHHKRAVERDNKIKEHMLDLLLLPVRFPTIAVGPLAPVAVDLGVAVTKKLLKEGALELLRTVQTMKLSEIKDVYLEHADRIERENPNLGDAQKKDMIRSFEGGLHMALEI